MSERDIKIVIKAQDEFSESMERASRSAEGSAARISKSFGAVSFGDSVSGINEYASAMKRVEDAENARAERLKATQAEREISRLRDNSPYTVEAAGAEKIYLEYNQRLAALEAYNAAVVREMERAGYDQSEIEAAYTELSMAYAIKRRDLQMSAAADTAGAISNTLQNIFVATGSKHKAIFETMKAFAIAETVIDTYKGATAAYAALAGIPVIGPALATAAAAAAVAAGMARVSEIRSTQPGGGSIRSSGTASPAYSGGSPSAYPVPQRIEGDYPAETRNITIQIYNPLSEQNWQKLVEENIVPALNDASGRNISVNIKNMG